MIMRAKRILKIAAAFFVAFAWAVFIAWMVWSNMSLELNTITVTNEKIPDEFDGYRIVQVSDLHNARFGKDNSRLIEMLKDASPDIIVITGDVVDSSHTNMERAIDFLREAVKIAPCYFVTGNHETYVKDSVEEIKKTGVKVLQSEEVVLSRNGAEIYMVGVDDPRYVEDLYMEYSDIALGKIKDIYTKDGFKILLSHNPDYIDKYAESGADLVFCGHVHGGQFRLPYVGGLLSPNRTLFPKYDSGVYTRGSTTMIVSRGLGNSVIPVRLNNRPEVILAVLKTK